MSEQISASIDVPFTFLCKKHEREIIQINLSPCINDRLLCKKCNLSGLQNVKYIGDVFKFLSDLQIQYRYENDDIKIIEKEFEKLSLIIENVLKRIKQEISDFTQSLISKRKIEESQLRKCLNRQFEYSNIELENYIDLISNHVNVIQGSDEQYYIQLKQVLQTEEDKRIKTRIKQQISDLFKCCNNVEQTHKQQQLTHQLELNKNGINLMQFNRNAKLLALANDDILQICRINEDNQVKLVQKLKGYLLKISSISFSSIDDSLICNDNCSTIILEQSNPNEWIIKKKIDQQGLSCSLFGNYSNLFAIASKHVSIWEKQNHNWTNIQVLQHNNLITLLNFNKEDNLLVSADQNKIILVSQYNEKKWEIKYHLNSTHNIDHLFFSSIQSFISLSNQNDETHWKYSEQIGYEAEALKIDDQFMEGLSLSNLQITNSISIYQSQSKVQFKKNVFQFSKDMNLLTISAGGYLQVYTKII